MSRNQHFDEGASQSVGHEELRNALSSDYDVPMHRFAATARAEWKKPRGGMLNALRPGRKEAYDQHGGPDKYAEFVASKSSAPIEVTTQHPHGEQGQLYVMDGQHRALAALKRGDKRIPVTRV